MTYMTKVAAGIDRIKDVPKTALRKMCAKPMTPFEKQMAPPLARVELKSNEEWEPQVYVNSRYSVQLSTVIAYLDGVKRKVVHLWIRRHDGEMPRAWSDMQFIKNSIIGPERVGVEVFPPESELVDFANMAHLWVFPEDYVMPFRLGR